MILTFRPIKIWPEGWPNNHSTSSPFKAKNYSGTLTILERELTNLRAKDVILQVDASERDCRLDGQLRADAKVKYRGVILSFGTRDYGTLTYSCDAFSRWNMTEAWQANLRAIALGLEALRKVERYGIAGRGQQYAGYAELPSGIALGAHKMTVEEAAKILAEGTGGFFDSGDILDAPDEVDQEMVTLAFRKAVVLHHPDKGGEPETFRKIIEAKDLLESAS